MTSAMLTFPLARTSGLLTASKIMNFARSDVNEDVRKSTSCLYPEGGDRVSGHSRKDDGYSVGYHK